LDAEIIVEGKRRRNWPKELKRRIVDESYAPGVSVCEVARCHDLDPAQLFSWRKMFREKVSLASAFVPVELTGRNTPSYEAAAPDTLSPECGIEILLTNGRRLVVAGDVDPYRVARLAAALEAS